VTDARGITGDGHWLKVGVLSVVAALSAILLILAAHIVQQALKPTGPVGLRGDPAAAFGPDAYPADALRRGQQGRTVAHLSIGSDGGVTSCAVAHSSGSQSLDDATCNIALHRLQFRPARDADGNAIPASYTLPVRWVLPDQ
jgi:TonB family protein